MSIVRRYRLAALSVLVLLVLTVFLGFFFLFVLAPVVVIGLFYIVYLVAEERLHLSSALREGMIGRRSQLARESEARHTLLRRGGHARRAWFGRRG
ncbi:MAG TPA: hypothetical protein VIL98_10090 [Gaiellaceae bacterium]